VVGLTVSIVITKRWPEEAEIDAAEKSLAAQDHEEKKFILSRDDGCGLAEARNKGWRTALGDFLLFTDPRYRWRPYALRVMVEELKRSPEASYVYAGLYEESARGSGGRVLGIGPLASWQFMFSPIPVGAALFRRDRFPGFRNGCGEGEIFRRLLERDGKPGIPVPIVLTMGPPLAPQTSPWFGKRVLCTFSGKIGDILWTLPSLRELHRLGATVDLATMPKFGGVHELIAAQPYINRAFPIEGWDMVHDQCGAQPRVPPEVPDGYDSVQHLCYAARPTRPLIFHAARELDVEPPQPLLPFLSVEADTAPRGEGESAVAYAFTENEQAQKLNILNAVQEELPQAVFVDVGKLPFLDAAQAIASAKFFLGCRSANYVIACGLNKRLLTCEPDQGRREEIFSCPWAQEAMPPADNEEAFQKIAVAWLGGRDART
jgi:hypothetical protein